MRLILLSYSYIVVAYIVFFFFFSSRRRHTRFDCDWSSDVCSRRQPKRSRDFCPRLWAQSAMALYPRIPQSTPPAAIPSTVDKRCRRPWVRRGSGICEKKQGSERICSAVSFIFEPPRSEERR